MQSNSLIYFVGIGVSNQYIVNYDMLDCNDKFKEFNPGPILISMVTFQCMYKSMQIIRYAVHSIPGTPYCNFTTMNSLATEIHGCM